MTTMVPETATGRGSDGRPSGSAVAGPASLALLTVVVLAATLTACSSTNDTATTVASPSNSSLRPPLDPVDHPAVGLQRPHRHHRHLGVDRQRLHPVRRHLQGGGGGHRGLRRLRQLAGRDQRPQDHRGQQRRPVRRGPQQAGDPGRRGQGLRHGRRASRCSTTSAAPCWRPTRRSPT